MAERIISASGAPYDGYNRATMLESISRLGFSHVEPAFIVGYTEPFDETAFTKAEREKWRSDLNSHGLSCHAMSSHIDLGLDDAVDIFTGRMDFAAGIGAKIIATNASARSTETQFRKNIDSLLRRAEDIGIVIALENPGDCSDNLINTAVDGVALVSEYRSQWLKLNYDAANTASHRPDFPDLAGDAITALQVSAHAHIKDVTQTNDGWFFKPVGDGDVGCDRILNAIAALPDFPLSIELPLRLHRNPAAKPVRRDETVPLEIIENALARSLRVVRSALAVRG